MNTDFNPILSTINPTKGVVTPPIKNGKLTKRADIYNVALNLF